MQFDASLHSGHRDAICTLNNKAFPSLLESNLIDKLRASNALHSEHGFWEGETLVGYVAYSPINIENITTKKILLGLGPMAIDPAHQGQGLGMKLLRQSLQAVDADAVILLGHIGFYDKAGFEPAANFNLHFSDNPEIESAFMAIELSPQSLSGINGRVLYHSAFYEE